MSKRLIFILKYFLFWIVYFITLKILFLLYYHNNSFEIINLWGKIIANGIRLDLSATGYLMLVPLLIIMVSVFFKSVLPYRIIQMYTYSLLVIFSLLAATDLGLYREWGYRMDASPLLYVSKPREALASVSILYIINHLLLAVALITLFIYLFNRLFTPESFKRKEGWISFSVMIVFMGFLFLPIRGGLGTAPINVGSAYFSENNFANHAAINLPWNIGYSLTNLETLDNPYSFYTMDEARQYAAPFALEDGVHYKVLDNSRPNILLIILESFTAKATGCLGGRFNVTPELDNIAREGILFSKFYASGDRTDKGMLAIFSGYPAQPTTSIIKFPNKTQNLPSLPKLLREFGYKTGFYYGGNIEFANYKSYLINAGFEKLISLNDFPSSQNISSWGVPDEYLFAKVYEDIKSMQQPFFFSLFTLSSHPPYDVPMDPFLHGDSDEIKFYNSMYYTDHHLGKFIRRLENNKLLDNTLVIILADHGSIWPGNLDNYSPEKFHIPMVWYGNVLTKKDTIISVVASQTDLTPTLLSQMDISSDEFLFARDIFSSGPARQIVYSFNNGFGYVSDSLEYYYNLQPDNFVELKGNLSETKQKEGKAYYQLLYEDLLKR